MRNGPSRRSGLYGRRSKSRNCERDGAVYAAIDLGTNTCRMLAAKPQAGGFKVVDSFSRIVRLGEGLSENGLLKDEAVDRTVQALKICAEKIHRSGARRTRAVATEACRRAGNCREFLKYVKTETGLDIEPIRPEEEARLTLAGCAPLLHERTRRAIVFDIGGGSTELMWVERLPGGQAVSRATLSIPLGVVALTERFGCDAITPQGMGEIVRIIDGYLAPFDKDNAIAAAVAKGGVQMLGTSGTMTALGGVYLDLPRYDRSQVDGLEMDFESVIAMSTRLSAMDCEARAALPCIGRSRADLVAAGCAVLNAIHKRWPVKKLCAADRGIREGLLMGLMATDGHPLSPDSSNSAVPNGR